MGKIEIAICAVLLAAIIVTARFPEIKTLWDTFIYTL
jgi:hypothetical protein